MEGPTYGIVCGELHAARQHLYDMLWSLSQRDLLWVPQRADGVCVSYHFGHIALVEDEMVSKTMQEAVIAPADFQEAFSPRNADDGTATLPQGAAIIDYMQKVRERTLGLAAVRFRSIHDVAQANAAAEPFRRIINHEYSHTKYIRRICREMEKPDVETPRSQLIVADEGANAGPQYRLESWEPAPGDVSATAP